MRKSPRSFAAKISAKDLGDFLIISSQLIVQYYSKLEKYFNNVIPAFPIRNAIYFIPIFSSETTTYIVLATIRMSLRNVPIYGLLPKCWCKKSRPATESKCCVVVNFIVRLVHVTSLCFCSERVMYNGKRNSR